MKQSAFQFHPDPPRARRTDPDSSHQAATDVLPHLSKQRREVWEALRRHPGRSAKSLAEVSGLDYYRISRRLKELEEHKLAVCPNRESKKGGLLIWFALEEKP